MVVAVKGVLARWGWKTSLALAAALVACVWGAEMAWIAGQRGEEADEEASRGPDQTVVLHAEAPRVADVREGGAPCDMPAPSEEASAVDPLDEPHVFFPEAEHYDHCESSDSEAGGSCNVIGAFAPDAGPRHEDFRRIGQGGAGGGRGGGFGIAGRGAAPAVVPAPARGGAEPSAGGEGYDSLHENSFHRSAEDPLSTFSLEVDTASYANVRRFLRRGQAPPIGAVRIEELVNYFTYAYEPPSDGRPFAVRIEMAACPWNHEHQLLRIGVKGRPLAERPPSNLVFLIDVSGSMAEPNKLSLVKQALGLLVDRLCESDRVAIVTYAGEAGVALPPTSGDRKAAILGAIERLHADGGTNGGAGIEMAYALAKDHFLPEGTNRVILATDGDWNVGVTSPAALDALIAEKAKSGVFLTVLGFGMGNLKDNTMERLAKNGKGNYAYVDSLAEAQKVLVEQMGGTLCVIAKDVKAQVEFNPARAAGYRLLGYEDRVLAKEDFNDDRKDGGAIGAGHTVTAMYEVVPAGGEVPAEAPAVDKLRYQAAPAEAPSLDVCTVKLRWKEPTGSESVAMEVPLKEGHARFDDASGDFRFAAAVAGYGMLLRHSGQAKGFTWEAVREIAAGALGEDPSGYRKEFLELVAAAKAISPSR